MYTSMWEESKDQDVNVVIKYKNQNRVALATLSQNLSEEYKSEKRVFVVYTTQK